MGNNIILDHWLTDQLNRKVYRVELDNNFINKKLKSEYKFFYSLKKNPVFMYSKVPERSFKYIKFLEKQNFHLVDTNIILIKNNISITKCRSVCNIRFANPEDETGIIELAKKLLTTVDFLSMKSFPMRTLLI